MQIKEDWFVKHLLTLLTSIAALVVCTGCSLLVAQGGRVHGIPALVNLFGIESPGLTASLAIANHVEGLVNRRNAA